MKRIRILPLALLILVGPPSAQAGDAKILAFPIRQVSIPAESASEGDKSESCPEVLSILPSAGRSNVLQSFPQIRQLAERPDKTEYLQAIRHTLGLMDQTSPEHPGWRSLWVPLLLNELIQYRITPSYGFTAEESSEIDFHLLSYAESHPDDPSSLRIIMEGIPDFLMGNARHGRDRAEWRESWLLALTAVQEEIDLDSASWQRFKQKSQEVWINPAFATLRTEKQKIRDRVRVSRDERTRARQWLESLARFHQLLQLD